MKNYKYVVVREDGQELFTVQEAAARLGISPDAFYSRIYATSKKRRPMPVRAAKKKKMAPAASAPPPGVAHVLTALNAVVTKVLREMQA